MHSILIAQSVARELLIFDLLHIVLAVVIIVFVALYLKERARAEKMYEALMDLNKTAIEAMSTLLPQVKAIREDTKEGYKDFFSLVTNMVRELKDHMNAFLPPARRM